MAVFVALCLLSRFAYSLNDVFVGRLARRLGRMEVAGWRGISLVVAMAPLLFWVPAEAWREIGRFWHVLFVAVALTGCANVLQMQAARYLPFGLRAAFLVSGISAGTILLGWLVFNEVLSAAQLALAGVVVASAVTAAPVLMAIVMVLVARLARKTHPFLAAWAWEGGAGLIFLVPLFWRAHGLPPRELVARVWRIGMAASPTAIGSGASALALSFGAIGVWGAVAGTQVLFTAILGAMWHREITGVRRWICFVVAAASVSRLALLKT